MTAFLNQIELEAATKLISDGLSMAKASMEQILQSPISIKKVDYGTSDLSTQSLAGSSSELHVIKTELLGELQGTSHLIFSENEVDKLYQACLPPQIANNDSADSMVMKRGFLTEIDNMVSAAVITELANHLDIELYGNVPTMEVMPATHLKKYIQKETSEYEQIVHFKAVFLGKELDISPDFIWVFHNKFVQQIKNLV